MKTINKGEVPKKLLLMNLLVSIIYFLWWFRLSHIDNVFLYWLLFFGEIYHLIMSLTFWFTVWPRSKKLYKLNFKFKRLPKVDIFIPVAGEPLEIVRETVVACKSIDYKNKKIYLLNDGFVAKKDNWQDIKVLTKQLSIYCITRKIPGGAKAGNINNALKHTNGELIAIFDADMIPNKDFLKKCTPFFQNKKIGFVQTPQYYKNFNLNLISQGAWQQQEFFFGPIMIGKDKTNSSFICGTNVVIRRKALEEAGGMYDQNIAEDFLTSLLIHQKGWHSKYIQEVLVEGLAPEDLLSYFKQQLRWARGSLEVLFQFNPIFKRSLSLAQKIGYLSSALFYFNGLIVLIDATIPLIYLAFGIQPLLISTTSFAIFFVPFITLNLYTLYVASNNTLTFRAIAYSYSSWTLQLQALSSVILNQKMNFSVTPKKGQQGNYLYLIYPHLLYLILTLITFNIALIREGELNPSVITNTAWALFNVCMFIPFIQVAFNWSSLMPIKHMQSLNPQIKNSL